MIKLNKYFYLYEIKINNPNSSLNGCVYYGKHITTNINDNYYGSGKILNSYKDKYGTKGLQKTILTFLNNEEELNQAEYNLIKEKRSLMGDKCLNLNDEGHGSFSHINCTLSAEQKHKNAIAGGMGNKKRLEDPEIAEKWREQVKLIHANMSAEEKQSRYSQVSNSLKEYYQTPEGKKEKEERKIKNKESNIKTAQQWRSEFHSLFGASPESYRKYGKQKMACDLFKKIRYLSKEEQEIEVKSFLQSIEDIV